MTTAGSLSPAATRCSATSSACLSATACARARVEPDVPARHRQAVGLAHRWAELDFCRNVEVAHHAFDDLRLLKIFLPEVRDRGPNDVEQLRDDRCHAMKVRWPAHGSLEWNAQV